MEYFAIRESKHYSQPDSGQNSLEYWDYAVELELLKGSKTEDDLELAANLGKALLLANRKLEGEAKEHQEIIEEQAQEIAFLTKQTAALREANESRLRIYEQLEVSIQELEQSNQRLTAESSTDKKRIKTLSETVEQLETKCEELQKTIDEQAERGRTRSKTFNKDQRVNRRSISCENPHQISDCSDEARIKISELESKLKETQRQLIFEVRKREDVEVDLACLVEDHEVLKEQLSIFHERANYIRSIDEDPSSIDDTSSNFCRKCNNLMETESNTTMQDMDEIEDDELERIRGPCALFKLRNGGFAYGSQESLGSMGRVLNSEESSPTGTSTQPNSLYSELNGEYWQAMSKCEKLLEEKTEESNHCSTCSCKPKSLMEEFCEVESSSSGFSEEKTSEIVSKSTQTDAQDDETPTTETHKPIPEADTPIPEYRKIFREVFYNIKQIVDFDINTDNKPNSDKKTTEETKENISPKIEENVLKSEYNTQAPKSVLTSCDGRRIQRPNTLEISSRSSSRSNKKRRRKKSKSESVQEPNPKVVDTDRLKQELLTQDEEIRVNENFSANIKEIVPNVTEYRKPVIEDAIKKKKCIHKQKRQQRRAKIEAEREMAAKLEVEIKMAAKLEAKLEAKRKTAKPTGKIIETKPTVSELSKVSHASIEVARLKQLEMSYAEVLKKSIRKKY